MKILVVYSSRTGNTRQVAEAVRAALPEGTDLFPLTSAPDPALYDVVFTGFWAKRGAPNPAMKAFLQRLDDKPLGLFGTMGARVGSPHARMIEENARLAAPRCRILGVFLCPGKVDPAWLERRAADSSLGKNHPMTAERSARLAETALHPDAEDLRAAGVFAQDALRIVLNNPEA